MTWFLLILAAVFLALAGDLWRMSRGTGERSQLQEDRDAFGIENLPVSDPQRQLARMYSFLPSRSAASTRVLAATFVAVAVALGFGALTLH